MSVDVWVIVVAVVAVAAIVGTKGRIVLRVLGPGMSVLLKSRRADGGTDVRGTAAGRDLRVTDRTGSGVVIRDTDVQRDVTIVSDTPADPSVK